MSGWLSMRNQSSLNRFVHGADAAGNAVDLFKGEWVSSFPPQAGVQAGSKPLYEDPRIKWLGEQVSLQGKSVVELGPMEGSHTWQMLQMGAATITAIESNGQSFMKCLVAKELLGMNQARYLCADFVEYLDQHTERYGFCLASGVLYHMVEPLRLLGLMCARSDALFIWTHYYDAKRMKTNRAHAHRFGREVDMEWGGFKARAVHRSYGASVWNPLHLGGDASYSFWLNREDILGALQHFGKKDITIGHENPDHPAGPSFCVIAR